MLTAYADLIIWADKSSPSSIAQIKTHGLLKTFAEIYTESEELGISILQTLVLILTNIKD